MKFLILSYTLLLMLVHQSVSQKVCKPNIDCPDGYILEKRQCVDVDECALGLCTGAHTECFNKDGGFDCNCTQGYEFCEGCDMCKLKSCDEGWERFGTACYQYVEETTRNWVEAEDDCQSKGAHLISINSLEERDYFEGKCRDIVAGLSASASKFWHIGLYREPVEWTEEAFELWMTAQVEPSLVWMDGEPYTGLPEPMAGYYQLEPGPKEVNHTCVAIYSGDFYLEDCSMDSNNEHICQKPKEGASCDANSIEVGNECFFKQDNVWEKLPDGEKYCLDNGGRLAKIKTTDEINALETNDYEGIIALTSTLKSFDPIIARLGEVYQWTDGTPYALDALPWETLTSSNDEDYMKMYQSGVFSGVRKWKYSNTFATNRLSYFCKKRL